MRPKNLLDQLEKFFVCHVTACLIGKTHVKFMSLSVMHDYKDFIRHHPALLAILKEGKAKLYIKNKNVCIVYLN